MKKAMVLLCLAVALIASTQELYAGRYFVPEMARWTTPDPALRDKLPNQLVKIQNGILLSTSPYSYTFDNPLKYIDPNGKFPYTFHLRAFAPPGAFKGSGFHDDRRGFSASTGVTSRINQSFTVDPAARTFSGGKPTSDPTYWNGIYMGTSNPAGGASADFGKNSLGSSTASVGSNFAGSNPAFLGAAPNIVVTSAIGITENVKAGKVFVSIDLSSKQFPATEALIGDNSGQIIFLGGGAAFGSAGDLTSADVQQISSLDFVININSSGVFQSVTFGGKTYSIDEWNKLATSNSAGPFERK